MADNLKPDFDQADNILLQVQFDDPKIKNDKDTGLKIAQAIYRKQVSVNNNDFNFFNARAMRWAQLDKWAKGTQDMSEFLEYFNIVSGNKAYAKIDLTPVAILAKFKDTLIESISKDQEYPCVYAVDDYSLSQKDQAKKDAIYRMHDQQMIMQMEQAAGMMFEPADAYVPRDKLAAEVYFRQEFKLDKEIHYEETLQNDLDANEYERVYKRKAYRDLIVNNIEANKIERQPNGEYLIRRCIPKNLIYNFIMSDTGKMELQYIGELYNLKIRDLRIKYGISPTNPNGLSEKEMYEMAKMAGTTNIGAIWRWDWQEQYNYSVRQPWDDFNILVFDFEIKIGESEYYVGKVDSYDKENIAPKNGVPNPTSDKATVYKKKKNPWQRGIYFPRGDKMIYWGKPDILIYPFLNMNDGLSSYTLGIPNNDGEYVPSLFERALEPAKEYCLAKMKRKQLISKIRPSGIRIDVESARNVDLGGGDIIPWEEVVRVYDQSGNEIWSSRGLHPNEKESPAITNGTQDDTLQKIIQVSQTIKESEMEIRGLMGVPLYRDGSDVGDRTAAKLAEGQNQSSYNVTDFIPNAHNQVMEETLYKLCILHWQDAVKEDKTNDEDLINTVLNVRVKMKSTAYERQLLEQNISTWSQVIVPATGKPALSPKDAFRIRNTENYKLAEWYLADTVEENEQRAEEQKAKDQQANIQSQRASAQDAAQAQDELEQKKMLMEAKTTQELNKEKKEQILLQGFMDLYKQGLQVPSALKSLESELMQSIHMSLFAENKQDEEDISAAMMQEQQAQQQAEMQQQQGQQMPPQEQQQQPMQPQEQQMQQSLPQQ